MSEWHIRRKEFKQTTRLLEKRGLAGNPGRAEASDAYCERTLDEAYYPALDEDHLWKRNRDQVIQNHQSRENGELRSNDAVLPILLVPQLWLWKVENVLISAYAKIGRQNLLTRPNAKTLDLRSAASIDLKMAVILQAFINDFGRRYEDASLGISFLSTLDLFETALVATLSDVRDYITNRESQQINTREESRFIESISDIQNELDMIQSIIKQQKDVVNDFCNEKKRGVQEQEQDRERRSRSRNIQQERKKQKVTFTKAESEASQLEEKHMKDLDICRRVVRVLEQASERLNKYTKRIEKINRDADRVSKTMDDMLNLSRTDASVQLAESSIKEARHSILIGLAALAFAVVTITFTPLSFVTSLLALPIDQPNTDERVYESKAIGWKLGMLCSQ